MVTASNLLSYSDQCCDRELEMTANFHDGAGAETLFTPDHAIIEYTNNLRNNWPVLSVLSICLIHGLGGGRVSTWKKGEVFWPYNLLARDISEARVISWGYNADISHFLSPMSTNSVRDHARSLSNALSLLRSSPETAIRPIIFIAHSLGGIICAKVSGFCEALS